MSQREFKPGQIRVGISGYGNIGKAAERIITQFHPDMSLSFVSSRREIQTNSRAIYVQRKDLPYFNSSIDVLLLCGGSKDDLPKDGPILANKFNTVDTYDDHSNMESYENKMSLAALNGGKLAIYAAGWDPGKFSKERIEAEAYYPDGHVKSFWGDGVSQGHSNAIREFNNATGRNWILDAIQYTHPISTAIDLSREGKADNLTAREQHRRECFVAVTEDAQIYEISNWIKSMPGYFEPYDTIVNFVSLEEVQERKEKMYHAGLVIASGLTTTGGNQISEYSLNIDSNPEHTARILVAHARANYRLAKKGLTGAIPAAFISPDLLHHSDQKKLIRTKI